jgi:hypothetical protein
VVDTPKSSIQYGPTAETGELEIPHPMLPTDAPVFWVAADVWVSEAVGSSSVGNSLNSSCPTVAEGMMKPSMRNIWLSGNVAADVRIVEDPEFCMMILPAVLISSAPHCVPAEVVVQNVTTRAFAAGDPVAYR